MSKKYTRLLVDYRDAIAWVTINRPGDRNSIDTPLMIELNRVLTEIEETSFRAVVFTGAEDTYFIGIFKGYTSCHDDLIFDVLVFS